MCDKTDGSSTIDLVVAGFFTEVGALDENKFISNSAA
jgi:hypothetical protein